MYKQFLFLFSLIYEMINVKSLLFFYHFVDCPNLILKSKDVNPGLFL